jgi:D-alanine--poly(phosphoribitol) ligase subunit 2
MEKILENFIYEDLLMLDEEEFSTEENLLYLGLNSLRMMRLVAFIEDNFSVSIPPVEVTPAKLKNIPFIISLIQSLQNEPPE